MKKIIAMLIAAAFGLVAATSYAADAPKDSAKDGAKKEAPKKKKESC